MPEVITNKKRRFFNIKKCCYFSDVSTIWDHSSDSEEDYLDINIKEYTSVDFKSKLNVTDNTPYLQILLPEPTTLKEVTTSEKILNINNRSLNGGNINKAINSNSMLVI